MAASPTQRTLERIRRAGGRPGVVEKTISPPGRASFKQDLWGFVDVIAAVPLERGGKILGVQATSDGGVSDRKRKMERMADRVALAIACGVDVQLWGWKKRRVRATTTGGMKTRWDLIRHKAIPIAGGLTWEKLCPNDPI